MKPNYLEDVISKVEDPNCLINQFNDHRWRKHEIYESDGVSKFISNLDVYPDFDFQKYSFDDLNVKSNILETK